MRKVDTDKLARDMGAAFARTRVARAAYTNSRPASALPLVAALRDVAKAMQTAGEERQEWVMGKLPEGHVDTCRACGFAIAITSAAGDVGLVLDCLVRAQDEGRLDAACADDHVGIAEGLVLAVSTCLGALLEVGKPDATGLDAVAAGMGGRVLSDDELPGVPPEYRNAVARARAAGLTAHVVAVPRIDRVDD